MMKLIIRKLIKLLHTISEYFENYACHFWVLFGNVEHREGPRLIHGTLMPRQKWTENMAHPVWKYRLVEFSDVVEKAFEEFGLYTSSVKNWFLNLTIVSSTKNLKNFLLEIYGKNLWLSNTKRSQKSSLWYPDLYWTGGSFYSFQKNKLLDSSKVNSKIVDTDSSSIIKPLFSQADLVTYRIKYLR